MIHGSGAVDAVDPGKPRASGDDPYQAGMSMAAVE